MVATLDLPELEVLLHMKVRNTLVATNTSQASLPNHRLARAPRPVLSMIAATVLQQVLVRRVLAITLAVMLA